MNHHSLLKQIPKGKVTTYKEIAIVLGTSARAAGRMLHANKDPDRYPCYKVVRSDGRLGGYNMGAGEKRRRLANDGVMIKNGKIVSFKKKIFRDFRK